MAASSSELMSSPGSAASLSLSVEPITHFGLIMHRMISYGVEHHCETVGWTPQGDAFVVGQTYHQQRTWKKLVNQFFRKLIKWIHFHAILFRAFAKALRTQPSAFSLYFAIYYHDHTPF
jgi:hypothetical protein